MTNPFRLGGYSLMAYLIISIISWILMQSITNIIAPIILSISSIVSIILWYEAIKLGMKKSLKDGCIVSLFFIVPYSVILIITYKAFFRDELRDAFKLLIWTIFSHPMRIIPQEINFLESINFFALEPFGIIGLLIILNFILGRLIKEYFAE